MKYPLRTLLALGLSMTPSCYKDAPPEAQVKILAPQSSEAMVAVSAKVDWNETSNREFSRRVVVDEILINIAELKLLGDNLTMRVDGEPLINDGLIMSVSNNNPYTEFPFSEQFLSDYLSVYARIAPAEKLSNSSVVVRARLYESPENKFEQALSSSQDSDDENSADDEVTTTYETPNPDSEPNRDETPNPDSEPNREETPNPDGEPNRDETPNPDGEPNNEDDEDPIRRSKLTSGEASSRLAKDTFINFEIRGADVMEMVALFEPTERNKVILAIPAYKWLTEASVKRLEAALLALRDKEGKGTIAQSVRRVIPIVVETSEKSPDKISDNRNNILKRHEDYRLLTEDLIDPKKPRLQR
ncbi:MAG: hypothetical protein VYC39_06660 [Myxococcota bacterium]|nr:hypothetical protein [Myxococcota bacterium]